jgi:hypothetical protein
MSLVDIHQALISACESSRVGTVLCPLKSAAESTFSLVHHGYMQHALFRMGISAKSPRVESIPHWRYELDDSHVGVYREGSFLIEKQQR